MAEDKWWFNKVGKAAQVTNPGSNVPNYGLTYDLATMPYDGADPFDALAESVGTYAQTAVRAANPFAGVTSMGSAQADTTLWDRITDATGWAGSQAAGVAGAVQAGVWKVDSWMPESMQLDATRDGTAAEALEGVDSWGEFQTLGKERLGSTMGEVAEAPVAKQLFWGLSKLNEYSATAILALDAESMDEIVSGGNWSSAHKAVQEQGLTFGETVMASVLYKPEEVKDAERFQKIRDHNTVFNIGALTFNVVAAWKADPNVIFGKGLGQLRDSYQGTLARGGRTAEVQRDILAAQDINVARQKAAQYTRLADKLRAGHALSLYDRSTLLREAARTTDFETFKNHPAFRTSASGVPLAKLMRDVADDDDAWNLVFRTSIGDDTAIPELLARRADLNDKLVAIELKDMPRVQRDFERVEARYKKRLAEQGDPEAARIEITRVGDRFLDDDMQTIKAELDEVTGRLSAYQSYESWVQRALPMLDDELVDSQAANSVFNSLERLGPNRTFTKVKTWQHDEFSPVIRMMKAPTKPLLKRVGVVGLTDVDEGASALTNYFNQWDHVTGKRHSDLRSEMLERFAGATTEAERKVVVEQLERAAVMSVGRKYGISDELLEKFGEHLQKKRLGTWGRFSDRSIYAPIRGRDGRDIEMMRVPNDSGDGFTMVKMPVEPAQLMNHYPLTNLTDLDRTFRRNLDILRTLDEDLVSRKRAGVAWSERHLTEVYDAFGTRFNHMWKPLALLSLRWPARVVADESMRVMLFAGALPHLAQMTRVAGYGLYNKGLVKPYEWWNGRRIKMRSLSETATRPSRVDYDSYDYRAITNPQGAAPVDALDFGKFDRKRFDKINSVTAERWQYLRSVEASRRQTGKARTEVGEDMAGTVRTLTMPERPKWAKSWDKVTANLGADDLRRGFLFDPLDPGKQLRKGFAVSVYPGRLKTYSQKPSARQFNYWVEQNSDLFAIPNTRAALWLDKTTNRWHLDVVHTAKRREDAMLIASRAEATEFYDIGDGFTRYMSEDFYGHFDSPLVKGTPEPNPAGGAAFDQAPIGGTATAAGARIGETVKTGGGLSRKQVGFGKKTWRSLDGRTLEGDDVFGADVANPNIYHSLVGSADAIEALYGGHTRGLGKMRAARQSSDYKWFDPNEDLDGWAKAYSYYVNNIARNSPLTMRMLNGQSDDEVYNWLMSTTEGRKLRQRMGVRGQNPEQWVSDARAIHDHLFPDERIAQVVRDRDVTPQDVVDNLPPQFRMEVHGDTIKLGLGDEGMEKWWNGFFNNMMGYLGSIPTDAFVRHPFAATLYNMEMRNYLSSLPAEKVTNKVMAAAEATARKKALRQINRTLYNIADEYEGVFMLRFLAPFFQAQVEVLERYARLSMQKPESVARVAQLLVGSQVIQTPLWEVTDREGNKVTGYSGDNKVTFQVTDTLRDVVDKFPGLKGALDHAGDIQIPVSSLNLVLQGEKPFLPSMGPVVTYPASEFYFKDRPELEHSKIYSWLFPFGVPKGSNFAERFVDAVAPAYLKRLATGELEDFDDSAFARRVAEIGAAQKLEWEKNGREGPRPTGRMALEAAKAEYRLRTASSFFMPFPVTPRSPYQYWIDQHRVYKQKYGREADQKFYDEYGPTFFAFAQQATQSYGMGPTTREKKAYDKYADLAEQAPDLIGVLTGPFAGGEFSDAVYQWQLATRLSPTSDTRLREHLTPEERIADAEISRGWVEYSKMSAALEAELRNRVANGGSSYVTAASNRDLQLWKRSQTMEIITRNPAWQDALTSRQENMATWLDQAYNTVFDRRLDGRTDIEGLRLYLVSRARLQDALQERADAAAARGEYVSDQLSFDSLSGEPIGANADLGVAWLSWLHELKSKNLLFAEIHNRYLEGDDLSTYIAPTAVPQEALTYE